MKWKKIVTAAAASLLTAVIVMGGCSKQEDDTSSPESSAASSSAVQSSQASGKTESSVAAENSSEQSSRQSEPSAQNTITPAVWEVKNEEGNVLYMMGTIHMGDASIMQMPDYFEGAFAACDALALECDTSQADISLNSVTQFMYTDRSTIRDHVSQEDYQKVQTMLQSAGQYSPVYDYIKPFMWMSLLEVAAGSESGLSADYAVDTMLQKRAYNEGKSVLEIEGNEFQISLITNMDDKLQEVLFHEAAQTENYYDELKESIKQNYEQWKKGEEPLTASDEEVSLTEEEQKLFDEYNRIMLTDRNKTMADKAEQYIKSGQTTFFSFGSAHFYGDEGLINLMTNRGYTLRRLTSENAPASGSTVVQSSKSPDTAPEITDPAVPRAA